MTESKIKKTQASVELIDPQENVIPQVKWQKIPHRENILDGKGDLLKLHSLQILWRYVGHQNKA